MRWLNWHRPTVAVVIPTDDQKRASTSVSIAADRVRPVENLQDLVGRDAMLPELVLVVLVEQERVDRRHRHPFRPCAAPIIQS